MTLPIPCENDIKRFLSYVDKLPNGCWFWTGARSRGKGNKKWYGSFRYKGKTVRAHRFACEFLADPPKPCPEGHHRDHTCCFSLCVQPEHFEVVTREINQQRKVDRRSQKKEQEAASVASRSQRGANNEAGPNMSSV